MSDDTEICTCCGGRGVIPKEKICQECGRIFRWVNDVVGKGKTTSVIYCSNRCARLNANRNHRARKRASL